MIGQAKQEGDTGNWKDMLAARRAVFCDGEVTLEMIMRDRMQKIGATTP